MNGSKTILYVSHVHWNWIKQRPQYLAEALAETYSVTYLYPRIYRTHNLKVNPVSRVCVEAIPRVPTSGDRVRPLIYFNDLAAKHTIHNKLEKAPHAILWLSSPMPYEWIPASFEGTVVYDCMDDHAAFADFQKKQDIELLEMALVKRANLIIASSNSLIEKLGRYGGSISKKTLLVRNGFDGNVAEDKPIAKRLENSKESFCACYFGTIGPWFDFGVIRESLLRFSQLHYRIIGPVDDGVEILAHPRIEYTGPVAHEELSSLIGDCDCFVMPFVLNDIVLSVDPVKLYEYINFGKDIICVRYPEVERFSGFAELYNGESEYCSSLETIMHRENRKYSASQRLQLLSESSWAERSAVIMKSLEEMD